MPRYVLPKPPTNHAYPHWTKPEYTKSKEPSPHPHNTHQNPCPPPLPHHRTTTAFLPPCTRDRRAIATFCWPNDICAQTPRETGTHASSRQGDKPRLLPAMTSLVPTTWKDAQLERRPSRPRLDISLGTESRRTRRYLCDVVSSERVPVRRPCRVAPFLGSLYEPVAGGRIVPMEEGRLVILWFLS